MENTNQPTRIAFEDVTLTGAYAGNEKVIEVSGFDNITLDLAYERGAGEAASGLQFTLEHSSDGVNWFALTIDSTSATSVITKRVWEIEDTDSLSVLIQIAYKKLRVSVQEAGVVTNAGTLSANYTLSRL